jgi:hypothetical protein
VGTESLGDPATVERIVDDVLGLLGL